MPVDTKHDRVVAREVQWQRIRDAIEGEDAVKAAGTRYLPDINYTRLTHTGTTEYEAYRNRGLFYNATARTLQGLVGAVFRKDPTVSMPEAGEGWLENLDLAGTQHVIFAMACVREVLAMGRLAILVDLPSDGRGEARPYLTTYPAETLINWSVARQGGAMRLTRAVLREVVEVPEPRDPFVLKEVDRYRVLELDQEGWYRQTIWTQVLDSVTGGPTERYAAEEPTYPTRRGEHLDQIPLIVIAPYGLRPDVVETSPLLPLVNVNMSHWRSSCDLELGRHKTALPTPYVTGYSSDEEEFSIGSSVLLQFPDPGTRVGMLEYTGQGLASLDKAIEQKEAQMVLLGARLLESQKRAAETAEAQRLRQAGESSVLAAIASNVSQGLTRALRLMCWWAYLGGQDSEAITYELNRDFQESKLEPAELQALVAAWQGGAIPRRVLLWNLRQGEILPPDLSDDEVAALAETEGPQLGGPAEALGMALAAKDSQRQ